MKNLTTKIVSALSGAVLLATSFVLVGLGFAAITILAFFALIAAGVAMIAAPFVALAQPAEKTA